VLEFLTLKPEAFGLDISDLSLKIVKLKKKKGILSLASFGEEKIKPGIIEKGEIKDEEALVKTIKEALTKIKGEKLGTNYVIASLPEEKAFLQVIPMPIMEKKELKEAVYFEAENYIPLPIDEIYLDSEIIKPVYNHLDHFDILIVALSKKIVDSYTSCLKKAGLIPRALEIESLATARALVKNEISLVPILLIDLGAVRTSFIIFSGYSLRFTSSIPVSSQKFTEAISRSLEVNLSEAEKLKIKYGLERKYQSKIKKRREIEKKVEKKRLFEALIPSLTDLIEQMKRYLIYYQSHVFHEHLPTEEKEVEKIFLCGGGANLKELTDFLSLGLKIPTELGNPWINILPEPLNKVPELSYEESLRYTTALGLALRGIKEK